MSRLSMHLPQLTRLALAAIAAIASYSVHVDRSASSRTAQSRNQPAVSPAAAGKAHPGSASTRKKAGPRDDARRNRGAESSGEGDRASRLRQSQEPPDRSAVVTVAVHAPRPRRPDHVDRLRAERGVERGVDRDFQPLIDDKRQGVDPVRPADDDEPLVGPATPWPAAPALPVPAAPDSTATRGGPPGEDAESASSDVERDTGASDDGAVAAAAPMATAPGGVTPNETGSSEPGDPAADHDGQQLDDTSPIRSGDPSAPRRSLGDDGAPPAAATPGTVAPVGSRR
jgi:hypothetical protein